MERAQPGAIDSLVRNYELGDALGQFSDGWVVPASEPTASAQRSDLDETAFTAFDETSSSSSLTVTIGPGEAFVDGWLATDTPTDVDLAASTTGQTVGVSWDPDAVYDPDTDADRDAADRVVVALESDVSSVDPFLPLWTFDTDGSGATSVVDERQIGSAVIVSKTVADKIDANVVSASSEMNIPAYPTRSDVPSTEGLYRVDDVDGSGRTGVILRVK